MTHVPVSLPGTSVSDGTSVSTGTTLAQRIAAVAPSSIALSCALPYGESQLTYGQLNAAASHTAALWGDHGLARGAVVAICLPRSFHQIVAALAALRLGVAYVPIDPEWPDERIQHVLEDSGAALFVAPASLTKRIHTAAVPFEPEDATLDRPSATFASASIAPTDLAYIIYTSGSTGRPKGVEITHANLDHLIAWHLQAFEVTAADRATHLAGLGFDAAVWEIWPYLSVGASLSLADSITRNDPALLRQWLIDERITVSFVPTPLAEPLIALPWPVDTRLRYLLTGGDTLHTPAPADLPFALINNYGPTECTVVATSGRVSSHAHGLPSIGKPIAGTTIYLLDEQRQPVADGQRGELYIGGPGVGAGYRNLPEQTAQAFLADPFSSVPNTRMFKTGDMASRQADGQLAFHGRRDTQEKIRGYRIELDEIIHTLSRHPDVAFSTVAVRTLAPAGKTLVAYLVPAAEATLSPRDLQEFAARTLPDYMVPSIFVRLPSIPLSFNGKVDAQALPEPTPENTLTDTATREPASEVEQILLTTVRDLLHTDAVGVEDDFFLAGGHSLLGTQVVLRARETFGVMLTLRDLFQAPTVALLAARIETLLIEQLDALTDEEALELTADDGAR